jgi:hypothetical protein
MVDGVGRVLSSAADFESKISGKSEKYMCML